MAISRGRRPRKTSKSRQGRSGDPRKAAAQEPALALMSTLADPDQVSSLVDAQAMLSHLLGMAYASQTFDKQAIVDALCNDLLIVAETSRRPGAVELLATLAGVGGDAVAERADAMVRLRLAEAPRPEIAPWALGPRGLTCTQAYRLVDEYGDVEQYAAVFAHDREVPGDAAGDRDALLWLLDTNDNGSARDVFPVDDVDSLLASLRELVDEPDPDGPRPSLQEIDPAELRAHVEAGMALETMTMGPPEEESYADFRALALGRLRLLPPAAELPERLGDGARDELLERFLASTEAAGLLTAVEHPEDHNVRFVVRLAIDHAVDYAGGDPLRVSPRSVETLMLDWLPRKAFLDPDDVGWLPDILKAWASFAYQQSGRRTELVGAVHRTVDEATPEFGRLMGTGEGRGVAGQILAGLMDEGVDLTDPVALQAAIARYNAGLGDDR